MVRLTQKERMMRRDGLGEYTEEPPRRVLPQRPQKVLRRAIGRGRAILPEQAVEPRLQQCLLGGRQLDAELPRDDGRVPLKGLGAQYLPNPSSSVSAIFCGRFFAAAGGNCGFLMEGPG